MILLLNCEIRRRKQKFFFFLREERGGGGRLLKVSSKANSLENIYVKYSIIWKGYSNCLKSNIFEKYENVYIIVSYHNFDFCYIHIAEEVPRPQMISFYLQIWERVYICKR